jgi:hypothetical protein
MGIKNVMEGFMVEIDYDKKNGSIVGQFVDAKTKLFSPDLVHKPWNRAHGLERFCKENNHYFEIFLYKDEQFGCFPKTCAVLLYSNDIINEYLSLHPEVDIKLACLVQDMEG